MANFYTWFINAMERLPSEGGQNTVVSNVHYKVVATDGINSVSNCGTQPLTYTAGNPFTDYASLTEAAIIGWVQEAMKTEEINAIYANLDSQIKNLENPVIITPSLPWAV